MQNFYFLIEPSGPVLIIIRDFPGRAYSGNLYLQNNLKTDFVTCIRKIVHVTSLYLYTHPSMHAQRNELNNYH